MLLSNPLITGPLVYVFRPPCRLDIDQNPPINNSMAGSLEQKQFTVSKAP
jgi:hypothetical protein